MTELWCESKNFDGAAVRDLEFVRVYNQQQLCIPDWVYYHITHISYSTLKRKDKLRQTAQKINALGGNYGNRKNQGRIDSDPNLQQTIETCIAAGGKHWRASQIYDILLLEFGYQVEDFSLGQLRAWLRKFRCENPQKWLMYMDASSIKSRVIPAFGSRSQGIESPNQVWELDSFQTDVVLKYKCQITETLIVKRYTLVGCIDLFTRRVMLLLSDTSKAEAICQLLAKAMIKWGVPEEVRTDRGKEYLSHRVKRFLENLRVKTSRCLPKHPEQKAFIERFIHTFQHRDLSKLPGFVGHSVADRQTLRSHPDWHEKAIELSMAPEDFQAWTEAWLIAYEQRPHGRRGIGLEGKSPLQVLEAAVARGWQKRNIQDPRELDFLMMAAPSKDGMRHVGRQGISVQGRLYVAAELGNWIGKRVFVCLAPERVQIYIYTDPNLTQYICEAVWRDAAGIDLAQIARQARVACKAIKQQVKVSRKQGQALMRKIAAEPLSLLKDVQEKSPLVQSKLHDYPALQAIAQAISSTESRSVPSSISVAEYEVELARLEAQEAEYQAQQQKALAANTLVKELFESWQQGKQIADILSDTLDTASAYLNTPDGEGFLLAITDSKQEENSFLAWLVGKEVVETSAINHQQLLKLVFNAWKVNREVALTEVQQVLHYLSLPAGDGALMGLADTYQEQCQFKLWLQERFT